MNDNHAKRAGLGVEARKEGTLSRANTLRLA